jgi:hypothetical protein
MIPSLPLRVLTPSRVVSAVVDDAGPVRKIAQGILEA